MPILQTKMFELRDSYLLYEELFSGVIEEILL